MASSMLFKTNSGRIPIFSEPISSAQLGTVEGGTYERVGSVWVHDLTTNKYFEVEENSTAHNDNSKYAKYLYLDLKKIFIAKDSAQYIQNFRGDYINASVVNKSGTLNRSCDGLYGPNDNSPVKKASLSSGATVKTTREINGWSFIISPVEAWIKTSNITDTTQSSSSGYFGDGKQTSDNTSIVNSTNRAPTDPGRILKGSGVDISGDAEIKALIQSAGLYDKRDMAWYDKFNRFGCIDAHNNVTTTKEYLFFTKPDLHIFANRDYNSGLNPEIANLSIFRDAYDRYRMVLRELQWSADTGNPFMKVLSNAVQSSLDLPSINANEIETSANIYGTTMSYRASSSGSDNAHDFSLEFEDTKYLEIYMLFKLYDEYERRKFWGEITPPDVNYIYRKILHDQFSIYKFITGEDGQSLIYWAKLIGVYPKNAPRDAFSDMNSDGGLKMSVQFRAQFVEDMDPQILKDFNTLIKPMYNNSVELPLYNQKLMAPDGRWAQTPYIAQRTNRVNNMKNPTHEYYLKWRV